MSDPSPRSIGRKPDFLVIGAQKSGTSSVAATLGNMTGFYVTPKKELHYFDRFDPLIDRDSWDRYLQEFVNAPDESLAGEASPIYLPSKAAPNRIFSALPNVRLVAILRNPVDRAYSSFWHARRFGIVSRSCTFSDFIERDTHDFGAKWTNVIGLGCYSTQITRFLRRFPREQMHVALFDDLVDNPSAAMSAIARHINPSYSSTLEATFPHVNRAHTWRFPRLSRRVLNPRGEQIRNFSVYMRLVTRHREVIPPMDARDRMMLTEIFRPWNRQLEDILDQSLSQWGTS
jgi:hypothetical protein